MLRISYSDRELDIEGLAQDYVDLHGKIDKLIEDHYTSTIEMLCDADFDPSPYDENCHKIHIILGSEKNEFSVVNSILIIKGSSIALKNFRDNLPTGVVEDAGQVRYHHHYDACSFPEYISSDSPEIVMSLRQ